MVNRTLKSSRNKRLTTSPQFQPSYQLVSSQPSSKQPRLKARLRQLRKTTTVMRMIKFSSIRRRKRCRLHEERTMASQMTNPASQQSPTTQKHPSLQLMQKRRIVVRQQEERLQRTATLLWNNMKEAVQTTSGRIRMRPRPTPLILMQQLKPQQQIKALLTTQLPLQAALSSNQWPQLLPLKSLTSSPSYSSSCKLKRHQLTSKLLHHLEQLSSSKSSLYNNSSKQLQLLNHGILLVSGSFDGARLCSWATLRAAFSIRTTRR